EGKKTVPLADGRAFADRLGEIPRADDLARGEDHRVLDDVLELAHVAGPRIAAEDLERPGRERAQGLAQLLAVAQQEIPREERDVLDAVPQRRKTQRDAAEPVVEVGTERAVVHPT